MFSEMFQVPVFYVLAFSCNFNKYSASDDASILFALEYFNYKL